MNTPSIVQGDIIIGDVAVAHLEQRDAVLRAAGGDVGDARAAGSLQQDSAPITLERIGSDEVELVDRVRACWGGTNTLVPAARQIGSAHPMRAATLQPHAIAISPDRAARNADGINSPAQNPNPDKAAGHRVSTFQDHS